jgi:hypothetical protein
MKAPHREALVGLVTLDSLYEIPRRGSARMQFLINARPWWICRTPDLAFPPVNTSRLTSGLPEVETGGAGRVSMREIDDQPAAPR